MVRPWVAMEERLSVWKVAANILNKQLRTTEKGWSSRLGIGRGAYNSSPNITGFVTKRIHVPRAWADPLVRLKQWKRNMRFGTWNVGSLYRSSSLTGNYQGINQI